MAIESEPGSGTLQALKRMESRGDDISKSRDIDFSIIFEIEENAKRFAEVIKKLGYYVEIDEPVDDDSIWDVTVTVNMVPAARSITDFEVWLEGLAAPLGGRNDGWGAFAVQKI
jgi:hypothetical protein